MVNQNLYTMKQPELGRKISELRKAKGLTQEELVEKCNLNVRTIQRIEAGEVTPRTYTIKALFEALGTEWSEKEMSTDLEKSKVNVLWLYVGFGAGMVYFFLSYFEITMEMAWMEGLEEGGKGFAWVKTGILIFFSLFLLGLIKLTHVFKNKTLEIALWIMLISNALWIGVDLIALNFLLFSIEDYYVVKLGTFGFGYGLMGTGYLGYKGLWSNIPQILGVLGIISGILIFSVVGALFGLLPLTLFELGELGFLIWGINKIGRNSSPDSVFNEQLPA